MYLNDLLQIAGIDPQTVLVLRHSPHESKLRKVLPWLAAEKPNVFNAYQQTQGVRVQKAMERLVGKGHVVSLIGHEPKKALFIGLYSVDASRPMSYDEYWAVPEYQEMRKFGLQGFVEGTRPFILWFDLMLTDFCASWKGKLVLDWHGAEISWYRWAFRNAIPIRAVHEESLLDAAMPNWNDLVLTWDELRVLPSRWRLTLSQWRGIYYIFDTASKKGYVGSAYGADNLLGRWLNYAATGHGGNTLLKERDPKNFRFSILQRVSPDMGAQEIIALEASWKERLHTRKPYGLNDN